jgi:hypothetical protein
VVTVPEVFLKQRIGGLVKKGKAAEELKMRRSGNSHFNSLRILIRWGIFIDLFLLVLCIVEIVTSG